MTQDQNASASTTAPKINNSKAPQQLVALMAHLNSVNLEREPEVSAIMGAIIAGQHVFMLGKPGIAKSHLIEAICKKIDGGKIFKRLFSATTERTELMGPISLRELEQHDHIVHNYKNMLPEAEFFFADELFKANSQTLNDLLGILNERVFDNGGTRIQTPLITCLAASNELPRGEELAALYDRFLIRLEVRALNQEASFLSLLQGFNVVECDSIPIEEIRAWQKQASEIEVTLGFAKNCYALREQLKLKHPELYISDRRFKQATSYVKARVFMSRGPGSKLGKNDITFLSDVLWSKPQEKPHIDATISQLASEALNKLRGMCNDILVLIQKGRDHATKGEGDAILGTAKLMKDKADALTLLIRDNPEEAEYLRPELDKVNAGRAEMTQLLRSSSGARGR